MTMQGSGPRDRDRIDPNSDDDIRYWAKELGTTHLAIIDAVQKAGTKVEDVRRHLDAAMAGGQSGG